MRYISLWPFEVDLFKMSSDNSDITHAPTDIKCTDCNISYNKCNISIYYICVPMNITINRWSWSLLFFRQVTLRVYLYRSTTLLYMTWATEILKTDIIFVYLLQITRLLIGCRDKWHFPYDTAQNNKIKTPYWWTNQIIDRWTSEYYYCAL